MIKIIIEPVSVKDAIQFVNEVSQTSNVTNTKETVVAVIDFFSICLERSILANPEKWNGLKLKDFNYVFEFADELKSRLVEDKFAQLGIAKITQITV